MAKFRARQKGEEMGQYLTKKSAFEKKYGKPTLTTPKPVQQTRPSSAPPTPPSIIQKQKALSQQIEKKYQEVTAPRMDTAPKPSITPKGTVSREVLARKVKELRSSMPVQRQKEFSPIPRKIVRVPITARKTMPLPKKTSVPSTRQAVKRKLSSKLRGNFGTYGYRIRQGLRKKKKTYFD